MGNEAKSHGIISTVTHNGAEMNVVESINETSDIGTFEVPAQGAIGSSAIGINRHMDSVTVRIVGGQPPARGAFGDIVAALIRSDGATIDSAKWKDMKRIGRRYAAQHNAGPDAHDVDFKNQSDMATDNYVFTPAN